MYLHHQFGFFSLIILSLLTAGVRSDEQPLSAEEYQANLGVGFSTSWFKFGIPPKRIQYTPESLRTTVKDMVDRGISHLRLRCMAKETGFPVIDNVPPKGVDHGAMNQFLDELEFVVDEMLAVGLYPVISWIGKKETARGSAQDRANFIAWWTEVAKRLKDKSYKVAFDLITEMEKNMNTHDPGMRHNLHENMTGFSDWNREAIKAIRNTGGKNSDRIIMLVTPQNTIVESLYNIAEDIYTNQRNRPIIQEYHTCAAGFHTSKGDLTKVRCAWTGRAELWEKEKLRAPLDTLVQFGKDRNVPTYFGAWMAYDEDQTTHAKVRSKFAAFLTKSLKKRGIPSTINEINKYYDALTNEWITENGMHNTLSAVINNWNA